MALKGSFKGSTSNQYVQPTITWSATQNIAGNYSNVTATLTYSRTNSGYTTSGKWSGSITINGTQVPGSSGNDQIVITQNSNTFAMSATVKVPHNADGSKSVTISCTGSIPAASLSSTSCSATVTLDTIPRKATITAASDFTDAANPSFTFSNPGGFPMDVWLEPNPVGDHLCIRKSIPNTGSYTWSLTSAEREQLRSKCVGTSCTIRIGLYSYVGGTTYDSYVDKKFTMTENEYTKPTVSMTATLNNDLLPSAFSGMYIQGKSRLNVSISAQGKHSASILSYSANIGGVVYNPQSNSVVSNVITKSGKVDVIGYAKDSRGFTGSTSQQIDVTAYSKPLVIPLGSENAIQCYRSDGNGNRVGSSTSVWIKAKRFYYSLSGKNQCKLQWRRKLVTDAWNGDEQGWNDLILKTDTTTDEYSALLPSVEFDVRKSYSVQIRAKDDIGEVDVKTFEIPTQDVALHLGKGGKNVSVGTYCNYSKEYTFYSEWDAYFDKDVYVGSNRIADFPIERGTDGIWTWEKWASGKAVCYGRYSYNNFMLNAEGAPTSLTIDESFPFVFAELPTVNAVLSEEDGYHHFILQVYTSTSSVYKVDVRTADNPSTSKSVGGVLNFDVKGRWK